MDKIKILVVEDEVIIADNICDILDELGYEALEPVISFAQAIESIEKYHPDMVILDIQLSGKKDGVDLAWTIKEDYDIPFIFLTSSVDKITIDKAKQVAPPAYLVKPFNKDELYSSIEIAIFNYTRTSADLGSAIIQDAIFVKQKASFQKVLFSEIIFIKSDHVYLEIHLTDDKKILVRDSLNEYIQKLSPRFYRLHRGYIINLDHLENIDNDNVVVGGNEIPIGKKYREQLLKLVQTG